jgi:hypothetical protein
VLTEISVLRAGVDRDRGLHLLRNLIRIRRLEERCVELYSATRLAHVGRGAAAGQCPTSDGGERHARDDRAIASRQRSGVEKFLFDSCFLNACTIE